MNTLKIGIDLDGVLVDFNTGFCGLLTEQTGIKFPINDPNFPAEWNYHRAFGVNKQQEDRAWETIKTSRWFWAALPHLPEAEDALLRLNLARRAGHDIYFITTRPGLFAKGQCEEWLWTRGYLNPTVLISGDKGFCAAGLALDVFIDDKPSNCLDVLTARGVNTRIYLREQPYNATFDGRERLIAVPTIKEMIDRELGNIRAAR